ncbi:hypothetical protein CDL12_03996 [Handroanthus impetiginosus]|uniref:Transmembrane protein n=1 Tax=Handroanthus impetiginosus TaxID=429701 RepID=A0A2G9I0K8_9LAMI|nr:hypothetical protein CDL12_03996 [Handroanthus impetiginosus]
MANGVGEPHAQNNETAEAAEEGGNEQNNIAGGEGGNQQNNDAAGDPIRSSLEERIEKKEEQILKLEASVFQLANYYFVFQGVIFSAIIKGSHPGGLNCRHFLLPFFMSFIGAALNFGSLLIIADKYKESLDQLDKRHIVLQSHLNSGTRHTLSEEHKKKRARRQIIMVVSMISFLVFVILNLVATRIILCDG